MATRPDARQIITRDFLDQVLLTAPGPTGKEVDDVLRSINSELIPLLRMKASSTPDLVLNIDAISKSNPETGRNTTIAPIHGLVPTFTSGTVTLDATGAGNATPSAGSALALGMNANEFLKVGVSLNSAGQIVLTKGTAGANLAAATQPAANSDNHAIGYFVVRTDGSNNVQTILNSDIYQYPAARAANVDSALPLVGTSANANLNTALETIDDDLARLYEDRNIFLTDGGLITYTGTQLQFTQALKLHINSQVAGGTPTVVDLGSANRAFSADGRMMYAVVDRSLGTAVVTEDATTLPAVVAANKEVFLIAKRKDSSDGVQRVYFRNGSALDIGQTARLGSSGSGSGSGSGGRNYVSNPSAAGATSDWSVSGDGSLTRHTTASDLPRASTTGTGFAFTSDTDDEYAYTRFTLDDADLTKKMIAQLAYKTSGDKFRIELWQNSQSDYAGTYSEIHLSTDSNGDTPLPSGATERTVFWDSQGVAYIELRIVHEGTNEDTIYFSDVDVNGNPPPQGAVEGPWTSYASGSTALPAGLATEYRIEAENLIVRVRGTTSGTSSSQWVIGLPDGFTGETLVGNVEVGRASVEDTPSTGAVFGGIVVRLSGTTYGIKTIDGSTNATWGNTHPVNFASNTGYVVSITFSVVANELAGSGTFAVSRDYECVYNTDVSDTPTVTTGSKHGCDGVNFSSEWDVGTTWTRRIVLLSPLQNDEELMLRVVDQYGIHYDAPVIGVPHIYAGGAQRYGWSILSSDSSRINFDVNFQAGGVGASGENYGDPSPTSFADLSTWKWYVQRRKKSGGAGIAHATATQSGLVKGGKVPGSDGSSATEAGYIGEIRTASFSSETVTTSAAHLVSISNVTPGVYMARLTFSCSKGSASSVVFAINDGAAIGGTYGDDYVIGSVSGDSATLVGDTVKYMRFSTTGTVYGVFQSVDDNCANATGTLQIIRVG